MLFTDSNKITFASIMQTWLLPGGIKLKTHFPPGSGALAARIGRLLQIINAAAVEFRLLTWIDKIRRWRMNVNPALSGSGKYTNDDTLYHLLLVSSMGETTNRIPKVSTAPKQTPLSMKRGVGNVLPQALPDCVSYPASLRLACAVAEVVLLTKQMACLEAAGGAHHFIKVWQIHSSSWM
jgi:hypothetical protein